MRTSQVVISVVGLLAVAACSPAEQPDMQTEDGAEASATISDASAADAPQNVEASDTNAPEEAAATIEGITNKRVSFAAGANNATVEDSITGYEINDYLLNVRAGQSLNVSMATQNTAAYFNILEPGETDVAIFVGSVSGNQFEGTASKSGDYRIRVYLMRSAARRDETASYRLEMIAG